MKFHSSYEVIHQIEQKKRNGIALRKFKAFMESLGNPHSQLKCIHVGGTNGKGSTCNNVSEVLQAAGYCVGLFTSPYLETHHDRIRINGVFISDEKIVEYANKYYDQWLAYDLSMFEIDMYIATQYFIDCNVDFAIFEVGMGGDKDATNIIDPLVSAITNVGLDHMEFLGNSYLEIAQKKAGVIKSNTAFITSESKQECLTLFESVCAKQNAKMILCKEPSNIMVDKELSFDYRQYKSLRQPTLASYQAQNAALAIEIIDYLRNHNDIRVNDKQLYEGLHNASWKGRFEVIQKDPLIILDGAHNNEGMDALVSSLSLFNEISIVFSALKDKPYDDMLKKLLSLSKDVYVCEFDFPRAQSAKIIANGHQVKIIEDYQEAIKQAVAKNKVTLVCGSLYFISQARAYLLKDND